MLAAEDFAFYSRRSPSMFYFIGARDTAEECFFVHHPRVVMNEACIEPGARFLSAAARQILADYAG
jgi:metal-dependent amidase/aminoacylase/carboxypeptidase family protein